MAQNPMQNPYSIGSHKKKKGPDSAPFGLLIGLLFPIIGLFVLYFILPGHSSLKNYFRIFTAFGIPALMGAASKTLSLATIANLAPFYFFLNRKQYLTVRGLLMSMVLILVLIVLYKFVWQ